MIIYMYMMYFQQFLVDVNQNSQNYTFTFTLTGDPSGLTFNHSIDSNTSLASFTCNSKCNYNFTLSACNFCILGIVNNNYSCSFLLEGSGVSLGYHSITIQTLLGGIVYGEITERFFVFRRMYALILFCTCEYFYLILETTVTFKESSYEVKEDNGVFNVTVQKFGETTESFPAFIRTRASNPTSATRMYINSNISHKLHM